jgi:hypothetical protein
VLHYRWANPHSLSPRYLSSFDLKLSICVYTFPPYNLKTSMCVSMYERGRARASERERASARARSRVGVYIVRVCAWRAGWK